MATKKKTSSKAVTMYDYGDDANAGFDDISNADLQIPFLAVLQSNSPQVVDEEPAGSKPGMFFNTVTQELYPGDSGVCVTPVHIDHCYLEWKPRDDGGGFVGRHDLDSAIVRQAQAAPGAKAVGKLYTDDGNELIETYGVSMVLLEDDGITVNSFAAVSFTSTKIKPFKTWLTNMRMLKGRPPLFANRARLTTVKQKNDFGTFYNIKITPFADSWETSLVNPGDEAGQLLLEKSKGFMATIDSGQAQLAHDTSASAEDDLPY